MAFNSRLVLVLSGSSDATADYLVGRLRHANVRFLRIDTDRVTFRSASVGYSAGTPILSLDGSNCRPDDVSSVWLRRPEPLNVARELEEPWSGHANKEWRGGLEGFLAHVNPALWINHPSSNMAAAYKIEQLSRAATFGMSVPRTIVPTSKSSLLAFVDELGGDVVAKPVVDGLVKSGQNEKLIYTNSVGRQHVLDTDDDTLVACPTIFQEKIRKRGDIRATVVDGHWTWVLLTKDPASAHVDIRWNNMSGVRYEPIAPPPDVQRSINLMTNSYGLRFAAVDFVIDADGRWYFLEINPNGQWAWLDLVGVSSIWQSFARVWGVT